MSAYRRLTDVELGLLGDDELVAQIGIAREAGDLDGAKLASQVLALGFQDQIRIKVARKVPAQDIDEVAQEVLISLINASFDGKVMASFRAFMNTIVKYRIADYWRAQERHPRQDPLLTSTAATTRSGAASPAPRTPPRRSRSAMPSPGWWRRATRGTSGSSSSTARSWSRAARTSAAPAWSSGWTPRASRITVDNVQQVWRRFKVDLKAELDSGEDGGTSDG